MVKVKLLAWSTGDGSVAVRVKVRAWLRTPAKPSIGALIAAVGAVLLTVRVVGGDVFERPCPSSTRRRTLKVDGPSLIAGERALSCAQVSVGDTPVASPYTPSPLRSHE